MAEEDTPQFEPASKPGPQSKEYWTEEKKAEHKIRGEAHELAKQGRWDDAVDTMNAAKIPWPPFNSTPKQPSRRKMTEEWAKSQRENGAKGGRPVGTGHQMPTKLILATPEDTDKLIDITTEALLAGKGGIQMSPKLGELTADDKAIFQRVTKISAEEFNQRLSDKLSDFADKVLDRMLQKLEEDKFRPSELSFALAVAMDKRQHLEGRNSLHAANVNIQVNNFGHNKSREDLIRSLRGEDAKPAINVTPEKKP